MGLLKINDLKVEWGNRVLIDSMNLSIKKGEILAVVGKSGSGKTMTFKATTGLLASKQFKVSGKIDWNNKVYSPRDMSVFLGKEISYVMQNPMTAFNPVITIGSHCRETLTYHLNISKKEADNIAKKWFEKLRLMEFDRIFSSYCYELSGGMLQRVMLALAMSVESKIIIADEPTTALDTITQKEIVSELKILNESYGVTIVFISHDFAVLSQIADNVAVISGGKLLEYGSTEKILTSPQSKLTKIMLKELIDYA
ncbi:MAG: ABC transporter ATP-binding protein [Maledivibacter sp.]|jgi:ABC-type dipeptide/oligopeptide/nickel transport system ATPase component|nr:ABC transporter ATP-binding protein [Maledivibacter sp.]